MDSLTVVFDLDGTLIDTIGDLAAAVEYALGQKGYPGHCVDDYRKMVGHGIRNLVTRALPEGASEEVIDSTLAGFVSYYTAHIDVRSRPYPGIHQLLRKLNEAGIKCTTLTKGLLPIELAELSPENEYGITLITLDEAYCEQMEPGAASCADRLAALRALHDAGCKTWVSMEPYPTPNMVEQNLHELLEAVSFTDRIIFGRTNYSKVANAYEGHKHFYNECAAEVISFCQEHGIDYHIKEKTITEE